MKTSTMTALLAGVALAGGACKNSSGPRRPAGGHAAGPGRTGTGRITGSITFRGHLPPPSRPAAGSFPECARRMASAPADPSLRVNPEGRVAEAFVWVKEGLGDGEYPVPTGTVTIDQQACEFVPRVFGVRAGQSVVLTNSDPMLHNIHSPAFNVALPVPGIRVTRQFESQEVMANITCDVHGWMRGFAGVVNHPYFAVTGADGSYALPNLPSGEFTVEVWQERLGRTTQRVALAEGEAKVVDFELRAP